MRAVAVDPEDAGDGRRRAARGDRRRRRRGPARRCWCRRAVGTTSTGAIDPVAAIARGRARARRLAARRRRVGRRRRGLPRAPLDPRRRRARRLLRHQPAQVAADDLRLQRLLGARPGGAGRRAVDPPGVPPQPGDRVGRGRRLPRLAPAARPTVPGAQALGGAAHLRAGGAARAHPQRRRAGRARSPTWCAPTTASRWSTEPVARAGGVPAAVGRRRRRWR